MTVFFFRHLFFLLLSHLNRTLQPARDQIVACDDATTIVCSDDVDDDDNDNDDENKSES